MAKAAEYKVKDFSCLDQFLALSFAQLTWRESLRDIEVNLRAQSRRLMVGEETSADTASFESRQFWGGSPWNSKTARGTKLY